MERNIAIIIFKDEILHYVAQAVPVYINIFNPPASATQVLGL